MPPPLSLVSLSTTASSLPRAYPTSARESRTTRRSSAAFAPPDLSPSPSSTFLSPEPTLDSFITPPVPDYTDIFGDSVGVAFAAAFKDLIRHLGRGMTPSVEPGSPAQRGSVSDEFDSLVESDKSPRLSDDDAHPSLGNPTEQLKAFHNKPSQSNTKTVLAGKSHVTHFTALPGYTLSHYESPVSWDGEDESCCVSVVDDLDLYDFKEHGKRVGDERQYTIFQETSVNSGFSAPRNELKLSEKHQNSVSEHFLSVSDISLRIKPSQLPPPSRPPPALFVKKGDSNKLKDSKNTAFAFDVEADVTLSPHSGEDGNKNVKIKLERATESLASTDIKDEKSPKSHGNEMDVSIPVIEEKMDLTRGTENISGSYSNSSLNSSFIEKGVKVSKKDQGLEEENAWLEMTSDQHKILNKRLSNQKGFQEEVEPNKMATQCDSHMVEPENIQQVGESERQQTDHTETVVVLQEAEGNLSEVVTETKFKVSPKRMDSEKKLITDSESRKQNSLFQGGPDDVEQAEIKERVKLRTEPEGSKIVSGDRDDNDPRKIPNENENIITEVKKWKQNNKKSCTVDGLGKFEYQHLNPEDEKSELTYRDAFHLVRDEKEENVGLVIERTGERCGDDSKFFQTNGRMNLTRVAAQEGLNGHTEEIEHVKTNEQERENGWDMESDVFIEEDQLKAFDCGHKLNEAIAISFLGKHDDEGIGQLKAEPNNSVYEAVSLVETSSIKGKSDGFGKGKNEFDNGSTHSATASGMRLPHLKADNMSSDCAFGHELEKVLSTDDQGLTGKETEFVSEGADIRDSLTRYKVMRKATTNGRKVEDDTLFSLKSSTSQRNEREGFVMRENLDIKDQKTGERIRRDIELENEEEKERERERAKDRMTVDKAALESRERSYAEVRERAEKAALDRANMEVRHRAMVEARQRLEKASAETKLRNERAAVERATAEARQRAAEKLMAQKIGSVSHVRVERSVPDNFPTSFLSANMRQMSVASDIRSERTGISNSLHYSYSSSQIGADGESPQRCKARLERYKRAADRAANALAEKNRRDLLAQREREEVNRVAETLDVEVRRWASGKEGNLRALLSTLQYILGPDSGWQPVPLTEVITSAAVKRAYRKATLCVHPDKLQQRGASIQQKYTCEKVFDLLKEAWNKFNSEER